MRYSRQSVAISLILVACGAPEHPQVTNYDNGKGEGGSSQLIESVVKLIDPSPWTWRMGSGVVVGPREILTAGHILDADGYLHVELADGSKRTVVDYLHHPQFGWDTKHMPRRTDSAIVVVDEPLPPSAIVRLGRRLPSSGQTVVHLGYGLEHGEERSIGRIVHGKFQAMLPELGLFWRTARRREICQGDSGGPLFVFDDGLPRLIGVLTASRSMPWDIFSACDGKNIYSAPVIDGEDLRTLLKQREDELIRLGWLASMRAMEAKQLRIPCGKHDLGLAPVIARRGERYDHAVFVEFRGAHWTKRPRLFRGTADEKPPQGELPGACLKSSVTGSWLCKADGGSRGNKRYFRMALDAD
ncbi:MAG: trypsin-like serine protease, partial [Planctomycetales bacterium]|nr:trypsin-like serine protease [Planctomycetales bacterium]